MSFVIISHLLSLLIIRFEYHLTYAIKRHKCIQKVLVSLFFTFKNELHFDCLRNTMSSSYLMIFNTIGYDMPGLYTV